MLEFAREVEINKNEDEAELHALFQRRVDVIEQVVQELALLEGALLIHGYTLLSTIVNDYTKNVYLIYPKDIEPLEFNKIFDQNSEKFFKLKVEFYHCIKEYFNNYDKRDD